MFGYLISRAIKAVLCVGVFIAAVVLDDGCGFPLLPPLLLTMFPKAVDVEGTCVDVFADNMLQLTSYVIVALVEAAECMGTWVSARAGSICGFGW